MFMIVPVMCGLIISVYTYTSWHVAEYAQIVSYGAVAAEEYRCYAEGVLLRARERYRIDHQLAKQIEMHGEVVELQMPLLTRWAELLVDTVFRRESHETALYIEVCLRDMQGVMKYRLEYKWDDS